MWTSDGEALYAKCFALEDRDGRPLPHVMRFNAYNRAPGQEVDQIDRDRIEAGSLFVHETTTATSNRAGEAAFAIEAQDPLARAGCTIIYAEGDLTCTGREGLVGALLPNGARFDLDLPFRFPFAQVVRRGNAGLPSSK